MKIRHYVLGAAAMFFTAVANAQEPAVAVDSNFYIFLAFGQSNMEGQGTISAADKNVSDKFQVLNTTECNGGLFKWRKAVPPLAHCQGAALGPVDYFGRLLIDSIAPHNPNIRIGIVDVAIAGCSIELFDTTGNKDVTYASKQQSWMTSRINAYGGRPYLRLLNAAREAQKYGVIKGILLHQGETNNGDQKWPSNVKTVYDRLISQLNLKAEEVPLLVGEVVTTAVGGACGAHNAVIAKVPNVIPNSYVVSAANLAMSTADGQNVHFTANAYRAFGQRYAKQMLRTMGYVINELPDTVIEKDVKACDKYSFGGKSYTKSQQLKKSDVLENDQNQITIINLTVNKSSKTTLDPVTAETEYTWPVDGKTYTESQTLKYKGKTVNGCDSTITCKLTITAATEIDENAVGEHVAIYPNPATDVLNISVPACAAGLGRIAIYTAAGVEVVSTDFVSELESFDISNWSNGVYMVWVTDAEGNVWTGKFVKTSK
ncbi:MAG: T9SS type A sorting domain-containing protein [Salinivirgaceae bacterium]|nr:T9SS type A sorting domain-containing protein [Salinivirgaceae bacterium]